MGAWRIVIPSRGGVRTPHTWSPGSLWSLCSEHWTVTSVLRCDVAAASGFGGGCRERGEPLSAVLHKGDGHRPHLQETPLTRQDLMFAGAALEEAETREGGLLGLLEDGGGGERVGRPQAQERGLRMNLVIIRPRKQVVKQLSQGNSETRNTQEGAGLSARLGHLSHPP